MRLLSHRTELRLVATAAQGVRLPLAEQVGQLARQAATARLTYSRRGDTDLQFTIAGRPSPSLFLSLGWLAGILAVLWRFRRSPYL